MNRLHLFFTFFKLSGIKSHQIFNNHLQGEECLNKRKNNRDRQRRTGQGFVITDCGKRKLPDVGFCQQRQVLKNEKSNTGD